MQAIAHELARFRNSDRKLGVTQEEDDLSPRELKKRLIRRIRIKRCRGLKFEDTSLFRDGAIDRVQKLMHQYYKCKNKKYAGDWEDASFTKLDILLSEADVRNTLLRENCNFEDPSDEEVSLNENRQSAGYGRSSLLSRHQNFRKISQKSAGWILKRNRNRRQVIGKSIPKWKMPIYITMSEEATASAQLLRAIDMMIKEYEKKSCIIFKLEDPPNETDKRIVVDTQKGTKLLSIYLLGKCQSYVGMVETYQTLTLASNSCFRYKTVAHEFIHALGLEHEQSRPDRDNFVDINYGNIQYNYTGNFNKCENCESSIIPYNYMSIMHYSAKNSFAKDQNVPMMLARPNPKLTRTMGATRDIEFVDWHRLNNLYCADECIGRLLPCSGGYQNPNNCSQCVCPDGYGLDGTCDKASGLSEHCGGELLANDKWSVMSLDDKRQQWPFPEQCKWIIKPSSSNHKVLLQVRKGNYFNTACKNEHYEVRRPAEFATHSQIYCGKTTRTKKWVDKKLMFLYRNTVNQGRELAFEYKQIPKRNRYTTTTGSNPSRVPSHSGLCPEVGQFHCRGGCLPFTPCTNGHCVPADRVCNGKNDCRYFLLETDERRCKYNK